MTEPVSMHAVRNSEVDILRNKLIETKRDLNEAREQIQALKHFIHRLWKRYHQPKEPKSIQKYFSNAL